MNQVSIPGTTSLVITHRSDSFLSGAGQTITPLGAIVVPRGANYYLPNPFKFNALKLFADGGAEIPADSFLFFFRRGPDQDWGKHIRKHSYAPYYDLTEAQQRDDRFLQNLWIELDYDDNMQRIDALEFKQDFRLEVYVQSTVAVKLTEPTTRFEISLPRKTV